MRDILDERRLVFRVRHHWQEMVTGRHFPRLRDIDPWLVGDDWANCMLLKLDPDAAHASFRVVGANLVQPAGILDGAPISTCPAETILAAMLAVLPRCLADAAPLTLSGAAPHGGTRVLYRCVLLPLSEDDRRIDGVFGAANFRTMRPGEAA